MARSGLLRLGGFLIFFGIGSMILPMFNMQFRLLMWAEPAQPFLGIALALVGVALVVMPFVLKAGNNAPAPEAATGYGPNLQVGTPAQFGTEGQFGQPAQYGPAGTLPNSTPQSSQPQH